MALQLCCSLKHFHNKNVAFTHSLSLSFSQCLSESHLFSILNTNPNDGINQDAFTRLSVILLYYALNVDLACQDNLADLQYDEVFRQLVQVNGTDRPTDQLWSEHELEEVLASLSGHYNPVTNAKVRFSLLCEFTMLFFLVSFKILYIPSKYFFLHCFNLIEIMI